MTGPSHRKQTPTVLGIERRSGPNQNPPGHTLYPQWHEVAQQISEVPLSKPSRVHHGPPIPQQDPRFQPCQAVMIPPESNGRPGRRSRAQPSPSESLPSPCESDRDSSQKSLTSAQAREKHKEKEQQRRDTEKDFYDNVPEFVAKYGVKLRPSENKKFVTKESKLKGLIECIEILDARAKQWEAMAKQLEDKVQERRDGGKGLYEKVPEIVNNFGIKMKVSENKFVTKCCNHEALMESIETLDARVKQLEDEVQKFSRKLKISEAKAKQSENKAQKLWRILKNLRSQMRSLGSDGAGDTEWDWCDDDQTLIARSSSHDSDFGGSIRQSHSGGQLEGL
ncbi:MAG: hypothetical protein Q9195_001930 [Heterodermia aff. obscurata]